MGGKDFKMKKLVTVMIMAVAMFVGLFIWWLTPVQPHHYILHVVKGGETSYLIHPGDKVAVPIYKK